MSAADVVPRADVVEVHALEVGSAPEAAVAAALAVTAAEAPLLRRLFLLRGIRARADLPVWEAMQRAGFVAAGEATLAAVVPPWRPRGAIRAGDPDLQGGLRGFAEPGWAVVAVDFRAEEGRLVTETRVRCTDAAARRRFRAYWLVVRPFSGLVRRSWLAAAKRRAEGSTPG